MNSKAICADMAFQHPDEMQVLYGMHNLKIIPTGLRTTSEAFSWLVDTASKNLVAAIVKNVKTTLSVEAPVEFATGRRPRNLLDPTFVNPEQLTSTTTKYDFSH